MISGSTPFWRNNPYAGTHVHLGLRYVRKTKAGWSYPGSKLLFQVINHNNGYFGSVDPLPVLMAIKDDVLKEDALREIRLTIISLANSLIKRLTI